MTSFIGRPPKEPSRQVVVRIPESLYAELMLLKAGELLNSQMQTKYGAITSYFVRLIREDLERTKEEVRRAMEPKAKEEEVPSVLRRQAE